MNWPEISLGVTLSPLFFLASILFVFALTLLWSSSTQKIGKWFSRRVPKNWSYSTKIKLTFAAVLAAGLFWTRSVLFPVLAAAIIAYYLYKRDNLWLVKKTKS